MAGNVLRVNAASGGVGARRGPPTFFLGPMAGKERRLEIHVFAAPLARVTVSRAWEHSVWRDAHVVIAECPAPHLSPALEAVLQTVASRIAMSQCWIGMGRVTFSLDDCSKAFRVIATAPGMGAATYLPVQELPAGHVLALHIKSGLQPAIDILICGASRGDTLRRAHRALANFPFADEAKRRLLMNRIASRAFCEGLTGSRLDQKDPANLAV